MLESRKKWLPAVLVFVLVPAALLLADSRPQAVVVAEAPEADAPTYVYFGSNHEVAYMGVQLEEETDHPEGGARVSEVVPDSPAEKAGLQSGDIIIVFDGKTIRGPVGLTKQIHERKPGDTVRVDVLRGGQVKTIEIELADRSAGHGVGSYMVAPFADVEFVTPEMEHELQEKIERSLEHLEHIELPDIYGLRSCEEAEDCDDFNFSFRWGGKPRLGVQLVETTPELREHLGSSDGTGVLVSKVMRGLPAEHAGIQVGDLIVRVAGDPVEEVSDLRRALNDRAGETFTVEVVRDGRSLDIDVTLPETDEDEISGPRAFLRHPPRAPRVPAAPPVRVAPPAAPAVPDPAAPPVRVAPRSQRQVEAVERQQAELRAALARAESRQRHEAVARAEFEHARQAHREAAAVQREEARRQREEIRLLRERLRGADGSV